MNIIIAYDEKDTKLGDYFLACKGNVEDILREQNITPKLVPAKLCNMTYVDEIALPKNAEAFIFVAYSHGTEDGKNLVVDSEKYVAAGGNTQKFKNALFYTNACAVGAILGKDLIANGCQAFIGYSESIRVLEFYKPISMNCDNYALIYFLSLDATIYEAFLSMEKYYEEKVDEFLYRDPLSASILEDAKNSLVFYGNKELKKQDFL